MLYVGTNRLHTKAQRQLDLKLDISHLP